MKFRWCFLLAVTPVLAGPLTRWQPAGVPWDRELGSHRVVVQAAGPADGVARALLEWRRPDRDPEKKAVIVVDMKTGKRVPRAVARQVSAVSGEILFQPVSGAGEYAVYFLPVKIEGGAFPVSRYLEPAADDGWPPASGTPGTAEPVRWEALSAHDAWTDMEVIATGAETKALMTRWPEGVAVLIPEKDQSIRMRHAIPRCLAAAETAPRKLRTGPGGELVFQIALWSPERDLDDLQFSFSCPADKASWINPQAIRNLTSDRTDWNGVTTRVPASAARGTVQPVWFSLKAPDQPGTATLEVQVSGRSGRLAPPVPLEIEVTDQPADSARDADPQSLSRLRWLNATTAIDDEPVKGYTPLTVQGQTIRCLGRELELGPDGLPRQIRSCFNKAVTKIMDRPVRELLQQPARFYTTPHTAGESARGAITGSGLTFTRTSPGVVEWTAPLSAEGLNGTLTGRMEGDGSVRYRVAIEAAGRPKDLAGIHLELIHRAASPHYILGLQQETGVLKPGDSLQWHWDTANRHQDSLWLGSVNGGLRVQLKAENYVRPSVNIHYRRRPLNDPPSWNAGGTGTITLDPETEGGRCFTAGSGPVKLEPGKPLHFDFDLLITPFHPLRTREQWADRYYQTSGVPREYQKYLDNARAAGANVVNIHQGNGLNPYINYPFLTADKLGAFSQAAHDRGLRAKYYYTVRELSNWSPEIFALRSMGDEILMPGKGGGHPWGEEHLGGNYWQAWYEPGVQDVSFLTQPMSRFHNYYIEGLRWLCENAGCDGIYLDDIAYDRSIMQRARKVLDRFCPRGGLIDLHSWNEFHEGGAWAHCANIFMDSMPFVDRLWFGEGHHYTGPPPEHFLVEISGIPFGLMGEMLEGGGNPWLGLVHGMTGRLGWGGDPADIWKLWDDFGVHEAEFTGWWAEDECPVRTADPMVKASVWKKQEATLVALANFSPDAKPAALHIDWKALGLNPAKAKLFTVPLPRMKQRAALLDPAKPLLVKPHAGVVFLIDEKEHPLEAAPAMEAMGPVLLDEDFSRGTGQAWTAVVSPQAQSAGRVDAGYVFQIPAHVYGYLERPLPENAGAVTARIWQDGRDEGQQWGPGLAVVWPDGQTLRTNIRKDGRLSVFGGGTDSLDSSITARAPVELTIRWDRDRVTVTASGPAMGDLAEEIGRFPRSRFPGVPRLLRTGKMPNGAGPQDHSEPGPPGFNRIEWVRIFGMRQ